MLALWSNCFQITFLVIDPLEQFAILFSGGSMSNFIAVLRSSRTAITRLFLFFAIAKKRSQLWHLWSIGSLHFFIFSSIAVVRNALLLLQFQPRSFCCRNCWCPHMCLLYVVCCLSWGCLLFFANRPSSRAPARIIRYIHEPCLLPAAYHFGYSTYETTLHVLCESTCVCCDQFSIKCPLTSPETVADAAAQSQQILPPQQHASAGPLPTFTNQGNFSSKPCAGIPNMITLLFHPFAKPHEIIGGRRQP